MAYDEGLAERLRDVLSEQIGVTEKKMFGGLAFLWQGHMFCGIAGEDLMVRVGAERYEQALLEPHTRAMDFTGRPMKGYVYVASEGFEADDDLKTWTKRGLEFVRSLPPK
ncbi:MAG: RNA methyltransferase [Anaerolineae bacterium]|nr:RNA methyltransferase [Anaerolineae bacterium]